MNILIKLIKACEHPDVLRTLYFGILLLDIVTVVVPIGCYSSVKGLENK